MYNLVKKKATLPFKRIFSYIGKYEKAPVKIIFVINFRTGVSHKDSDMYVCKHVSNNEERCF